MEIPHNFFLFAVLLPTTLALCWYPSGKVNETRHTPCLDGAMVPSTCCPDGYACLSNNFCKATEFVKGNAGVVTDLYRGSCTRQDWNSSAKCPSFCANETAGDFMVSGQDIIRCGREFPDRYFCPNFELARKQLGHYRACREPEVYFEPPKEPVWTVTIIGVPSSLYSVSSSPSTSTPSTSTPSTQSFSLPPVNPTSNPNLALPLGLGLGLPLGFLTLGILTYLYLRHRRLQKQSAGTRPESVATPENVDKHLDQKTERTPHWSMATNTNTLLSELPEGNEISRG